MLRRLARGPFGHQIQQVIQHILMVHHALSGCRTTFIAENRVSGALQLQMVQGALLEARLGIEYLLQPKDPGELQLFRYIQ